jgi:hypothetical protein
MYVLTSEKLVDCPRVFSTGEGGRRAADRLVELRGGNIGSLALGDTFFPNLGGFRAW